MAAKKKPQPVVISRGAWERLREAFDAHYAGLRAEAMKSVKEGIKFSDIDDAADALMRVKVLDTVCIELGDIDMEKHSIRIE